MSSYVRSRAASADYNLRILWPLARWVEDTLGAKELASIVEGTGVAPAQFDAKGEWVSAQVFETILERARARMPDDETFIRASSYRIKEAYGPIRYLLWATSPSAVYAQMVKTYHLVSTVGQLTIVSQGPTSLHARVTPSGHPISRLNCLVRQANCRALPILWGLPVAHVREEACIGLGDPTCELHLRWYAPRSVVFVLLGVALFGALGLLLRRFGLVPASTTALLVLLGGALGYIIDGHRTERVNRGTRREMMEALRELAKEEAQTRRELVALHQREKEWARLMEEQVGERTSVLEQVVSGMRDSQKERVTTLLGFSHDMRSPIQVLDLAAEFMRARFADDAQLMGMVDDMQQALQRMRRMVSDLVTAASAQRATIQFSAQRLEVPELTERLRRRLRALVHGRDIRATVFATRSAPEAIEIDPLLFDRIADNLLTNAAKYTERGSIVVEFDGAAGFLVLKVSDTGCGIDSAAMDRIFVPGGSRIESRRGDSFGLGLSVVVKLLERIGGRIEVLSRPGEGTTFWVNLPLKSSSDEDVSGTRRNAISDVPLTPVVKIRSSTA